VVVVVVVMITVVVVVDVVGRQHWKSAVRPKTDSHMPYDDEPLRSQYPALSQTSYAGVTRYSALSGPALKPGEHDRGSFQGAQQSPPISEHKSDTHVDRFATGFAVTSKTGSQYHFVVVVVVVVVFAGSLKVHVAPFRQCTGFPIPLAVASLSTAIGAVMLQAPAVQGRISHPHVHTISLNVVPASSEYSSEPIHSLFVAGPLMLTVPFSGLRR
jgi:hypothetical protein